MQKENIKNKIKQTKMHERNSSITGKKSLFSSGAFVLRAY